MTTPTSVPALIAAHAGRLRLAAVTRLLRSPGRPEHADGRIAALAGCFHASLAAGTPFVFGWCRPEQAGPITVVTTSPVTGAGLIYPPGAHGHLLEPDQAARLLTATPHWTRLELHPDALVTANPQHQPIPLDEGLLDAWSEPFTWLVYAEPIRPEELVELTAQAAETERDARTRTNSPAYGVIADRTRARHRELSTAASTGAWRVQLCAGAATEAAAATLAGLLSAAIDLTAQGYTARVGTAAVSLDEAIRDPRGVVAGTGLLAGLATPPIGEIPGVAVQDRSTFAVTPPTVDKGLTLGRVLDRSEHPAGELHLSADSLVRHMFVTGATGSGKTTTIHHLLAQASSAGLPWLVVEPAKAEYRHLLPATVLRIGHPDAPALGLNPFEPAAGFALRTHADMVKALLTATFDAAEPFPQIMAAAVDAAYADCGWDLATGAPINPGVQPRYPIFTDLGVAARRIIAAAGYGLEVQADVTGFVSVRIDSLSNGAAGEFLTSRRALDMPRLLRTPAIVELEDIGDDLGKSVIMGTILMRQTQLLRVEHTPGGRNPLRHLSVIEEAHRLLRRPDRAGPAAHAVETFAAMLAEVRAYGEGLIIADQIPGKLVTDVIKNTAVKVMHRLPGKDDRDAVGATTNLTEAQSEYLVGLPPGRAAVATDGMRQPVLAQIPQPAPTASPAPRSAFTLGDDPVDTVSCRQLAQAAALRRAEPALTAWADLTVLAHLIALPAPTPSAELAARLRAHGRESVRLALREQVFASVRARTLAICTSHSPAAFAEHVIADLNTTLDDDNARCTVDEQQWWHPAYRYNPARRALRLRLAADSGAGRHSDSDRWQQIYGHAIAGDTAQQQLAAVETAADTAESAVHDPNSILLGQPSVLASLAAVPTTDPRWTARIHHVLEDLTIPGGWASAYLTGQIP